MDKNDQTFWQLVASALHREPEEAELPDFLELTDEAHHGSFQKAQNIRHGLNEIKTVGGINSESSWKSIHRKIRISKLKSYSLIVSKYAAVILITLLVGHLLRSAGDHNRPVQYAEIEVADGQMSHMTLFDGTEVWLNSGTRFKYPNQFNQNQREVYLEGEGYFRVTPNKKLPFKVKTNQMEVEVLGTSFNISAYGDEAGQSVVLEEGKVQINRANGEKLLELFPGQRAERHSASEKFVVEHVRTDDFTGWKNGIIVFQDETLAGIAGKLERWYNVEVRFISPGLEQYKITGTILRNKPIHQTLQAFELLAPIQAEYLPQPNSKDIINIRKK
ncbi:FecR family protein [Gaoshiqia sp. Z1-71]|uniref:FecR family protein n=1 Tax=Gaoshiqia hydrogeniformans TaxID=3290090 RepID=UPI003BF7F871